MANNIEVIQAIVTIDSNADVRASGDPYDADAITLTWTSSEIPLADIKTKMSELQIEHDNSIIQKETDKANANQKLKDLGLTDDEIKAIKGIS